jgi:hypothetical protein
VEGKYGLSYNAENLKELGRFKSGAIAADMADYLAERMPDDFRPGSGQFTQFLTNGSGRAELIADELHSHSNSEYSRKCRQFFPGREIMACHQ